MKCFAYYRLPYAGQYTYIESDSAPLLLDSYESIGEKCGFVIAPFQADALHPIVLISPDRVKSLSHDFCSNDMTQAPLQSEQSLPTEEYTSAFGRFHDAVSSGQFKKLVLTRKKSIVTPLPECQKIFENACQLYPRLMIMLFHTEETGTWIVASPEILVDGQQKQLHTIALAGTMPYQEGYAEWSKKNMHEQQIVERYIEDTITPLCTRITKDGPVTMRAGNLQHLRTDFRFSLQEDCTLGQLISQLHPTPAVCGLPKSQALEFIAKNEGLDRSYYSGFAGPVGINDETHLYVLLRCAAIDSHATLYAGGGIMPASTLDSEWQETEKKMETIRNVFK